MRLRIWPGQEAFEPGDAFFAYTDGVSEGRNKNKQEYGMPRLKECLAAKKSSAAAMLILFCLTWKVSRVRPVSMMTLP